jgi:hypothetical protein
MSVFDAPFTTAARRVGITPQLQAMPKTRLLAQHH